MRAPLVALGSGLLLSLSACGPEGLDDPLGESALDLAASQRKVGLTPGDDDHAELVKLLPVAKSEGAASRHVALQLTPAQLPHLAPGDRLTVAAEVQVTTRCDVGQVAPGCDYDPHVKAQLILTGDPNGKDGNGAGATVLDIQSTQCSKAEHHCMFVFRPGQTSASLERLPCMASDSCRVNLVLWAWHPDARSDGQDEVLVGGNDHDFLQNHKVEGDVSRLMAVRERGVRASDRDVRETSGSGTMSVNTTARPEVVYSQRLTSSGLRAGERVPVRIICAISAREDTRTVSAAGMLTNLSVSGALLSAKTRLGDKGNLISVKFRMTIRDIEVVTAIDASIRSLTQDDTGEFLHGIQFAGLPNEVAIALTAFVYHKLAETSR